MTELPDRVRALRGDPHVRELLAPTWLDDGQRLALREQWLRDWDSIPYDGAFHAACRARVARCVPFAAGPSRVRRASRAATDLLLVYDPEDPDHVALCLSHVMPSLLWGRARPDGGSLRAALAPYLRAEAPRWHAFPRRLRLLLGYAMDSVDPIAETVRRIELWMDDASWSSAHDDDPWPDRDDLNMLQLVAAQREASREHPQRLPAAAFRTLWSRSVLRVERHPSGEVVFEARYEPAPDGAVIARAFDFLGAAKPSLPEDMPLDLVASLLRGPFWGLAPDLDPRDEALGAPDDVRLWCALQPAEASADLVLRRAVEKWKGDPEALAAVAQCAYERGHAATLYDALLAADDEALKARIAQALRQRPLDAPEGGEVSP